MVCVINNVLLCIGIRVINTSASFCYNVCSRIIGIRVINTSASFCYNVLFSYNRYTRHKYVSILLLQRFVLPLFSYNRYTRNKYVNILLLQRFVLPFIRVINTSASFCYNLLHYVLLPQIQMITRAAVAPADTLPPAVLQSQVSLSSSSAVVCSSTSATRTRMSVVQHGPRYS